jgi:hypothetical protein
MLHELLLNFCSVPSRTLHRPDYAFTFLFLIIVVVNIIATYRRVSLQFPKALFNYYFNQFVLFFASFSSVTEEIELTS